MSKHVVQCSRCQKYWNAKFNGNNCPKCGWFRFTNDTPVTEDDVKKLQEHFG